MEDLVYEYLCKISRDLIPKQDSEFERTVKECTKGHDLRLDMFSLFSLAIADQQRTLAFRDSLKENIVDWFGSPKKKTVGYLHRRIRTWIGEHKKPERKYRELDKISLGLCKFREYLEDSDISDLSTIEGFERSVKDWNEYSREDDIKDVLSEFSGMGEKTAGLFIKYMAYYSVVYDKPRQWERDHRLVPVFGYSEVKIAGFLRELYQYYAEKLHEEGRFSKGKINAPISIDVVWYAYDNGITFSDFIDKRRVS